MCVRDRDRPSAGGDKHRSGQTQASTSKGDDDLSKKQQRRNSCITEEGFEIALPPPSPVSAKRSAATATSPKRTRRRSIFDEDGNEIVLSPPPTAVGLSSTSSAVVEEDFEDGDKIVGKDSQDEAVRNASAGAKPLKFLSRGGSSIVSPSGDVLAGPQWEDDEGIIYADVDMDDCVRGRLDFDTAGSYSR
jgi:nitrilase